jgi:outer membrane protein assembly factor BamD (BamD/ComL family)
MSWKHIMAVFAGAILLLCGASAISFGAVADAQQWGEFGDRVLGHLDCKGCPPPAWLTNHNRLMVVFLSPDLAECDQIVDGFLRWALQDYEPESRAMWGRIPLHVNPECIFGLYLASEFPGTKLASVGRDRFNKCVELYCLRVIGAGGRWQQELETWLGGIEHNGGLSRPFASFQETEIPFLLAYLVHSGGSQAVRVSAKIQFANWLQRYYGIGPALRQRCLLISQSPNVPDDINVPEVLSELEAIGSVRAERELCELIVRRADSPDITSKAVQKLTHLLLSDSTTMRAKDILNQLEQRFSRTDRAVEDVKNIMKLFETGRDNRSELLINELLTTKKEEWAWQLCLRYSNLWSEQELIKRWQRVVERAESGSLAFQLGKLFLARSLVNSGDPNGALDLIGPLRESVFPRVKARTLIIAADVAYSRKRVAEAISLYYQASEVKRVTFIPQWFRDSINVQSVDHEKLTARKRDNLIAFLRGYNDLSDGNFGGTIVHLEPVYLCDDPDVRSLYVGAEITIPGMLMLAHMAIGDCVKAEEYGLKAIRAWQKRDPGDSKISVFLSQAEKIDGLIRRICRDLRGLCQDEKKPTILSYMLEVHDNMARLDALGTAKNRPDLKLLQLFSILKRQRVGNLISAEHSLAKRKLDISHAAADEYIRIEPILFCSRLIQHDNFGRIRDVLAGEAPEGRSMYQMYRLARYARRVNYPDICRYALDGAAVDVGAAGVEIMEGMAGMYLEMASHQKAIEIYDRIVEQAIDTQKAQKAQLKIITIYAEQLKLYDKAIEECQKFLGKFSDSTQASEVEFLIGKLAYLDADYASVTGQMDSFQRKYPNSPQVGHAMMFAALSRMSEGIDDDAIDRFTEIIRKYPNSDLAARGKLLIGYIYVSGQKYSRALETFKQLIEQYPKSQYVERAKGFIERLSRFSP